MEFKLELRLLPASPPRLAPGTGHRLSGTDWHQGTGKGRPGLGARALRWGRGVQAPSWAGGSCLVGAQEEVSEIFLIFNKMISRKGLGLVLLWDFVALLGFFFF